MTFAPLLRATGTFFQKKPILAVSGSCAILMIGLLLGQATTDLIQQSANAYSDVPSDASHAAAIEEMTLLGFLQGYGGDLFGPDDPVSRGQMAIIMKRLRDREIKALHAQIEELRAALSLGSCGDAILQTGEECDDGNADSADGCSAECLQEVLRDGCPGRYRFGEEFPAEDGCNVCVCSPSGIACTTMHCAPPEEPVVEEPAPIEPEDAGAAPHMAPTCGNGICEHDENVLPPHRRFHCPQDCTGEPWERQCEELTRTFQEIPESARVCQSDADCTELEHSCPFLTCGIAVNKSAYPNLAIKKEALLETCRREGLIRACVTCPFSAPVCRAGQCVLVQDEREY